MTPAPHRVTRTISALTVWIHTIGELDADTVELAEMLHGLGIDVHGPTAELPDIPVDALAVLIPAHFDGGPDDVLAIEARFEPWIDRLIPITDGLSASPVFSKLSQLLLGRLELHAVADRIELVARVGGGALARLVRLEAAAQQWAAFDRPASGLLRAGAIDAALGDLVAAAGDVSPNAGEFVRASQRARRRRNTIVTAGGAVLVATLFGGSILALVQRQSASVDATHARERTSHAASVRLAGLAIDTIGSDPDLPWLLAAQALEQSPTPQAVDAGRRVLRAIPIHRTVPLDGLPNSLSTDRRSDALAVGYTNGRAELLSGTDGRVLHRFAARGSGAATVALAPGAVSLFMGTRVLDVATGRAIRTVSDPFLGWVDAGHLLVRHAGRLGVLTVATGVITPSPIALTSPSGNAWSIAGDARVATLVDGDRVLSVDLQTMRALPARTVPGATDVATSDDGKAVFVASSVASQTFIRTRDSLTSSGTADPAYGVAASATTWLVADGENPVEQVGLSSGTTVAAYVAHRGPVSGVGALADGRTATIGADHDLRLWSRLSSVAYPAGSYSPALATFNLGIGAARSFHRALLTPALNSDQLLYTAPDLGMVGIAEQRSLKATFVQFIGLANFSALPLTQGRFAVFAASGELSVVDIRTRKVVWSRTFANLPQLQLIAAGNADGSHLAYAVPSGLVSVGSTEEPRTTLFTPASVPVAVFVDASGHASAVTSDGHWYREGRMRVSLPSLGAPLAAAASDASGGLFMLGTNGELADFADGRLRVISQLGSTLGGFALRTTPAAGDVAVLGATRSVVVDAGSGADVMDLSPVDATYSAVRDIAFGPENTIWVVRADGGIVRSTLSSAAAMTKELATQAPRAETAGERAQLAGVVTIVGTR